MSRSEKTFVLECCRFKEFKICTYYLFFLKNVDEHFYILIMDEKLLVLCEK